MGLDMYVYLKKSDYKSRSQWRQNDLEYPKELKEFQDNILDRNFMSEQETHSYQVGYWRKANAIHGWIVNNLADGEDKCQEIYMSLESIKQLISVCQDVFTDPSEAERLLPPEEGFFFGSQEIDEWYMEDIKYTIKLFEKIKAFLESEQGEEYRCIYQASW